jgi:hypothetical protein
VTGVPVEQQRERVAAEQFVGRRFPCPLIPEG